HPGVLEGGEAPAFRGSYGGVGEDGVATGVGRAVYSGAAGGDDQGDAVAERSDGGLAPALQFDRHGEQFAVALLDRLAALHVGAEVGDVVGVLGEQSRVGGGVTGVPGLVDAVEQVTDLSGQGTLPCGRAPILGNCEVWTRQAPCSDGRPPGCWRTPAAVLLVEQLLQQRLFDRARPVEVASLDAADDRTHPVEFGAVECAVALE